MTSWVHQLIHLFTEATRWICLMKKEICSRYARQYASALNVVTVHILNVVVAQNLQTEMLIFAKTVGDSCCNFNFNYCQLISLSWTYGFRHYGPLDSWIYIKGHVCSWIKSYLLHQSRWCHNNYLQMWYQHTTRLCYGSADILAVHNITRWCHFMIWHQITLVRRCRATLLWTKIAFHLASCTDSLQMATS